MDQLAKPSVPDLVVAQVHGGRLSVEDDLSADLCDIDADINRMTLAVLQLPAFRTRNVFEHLKVERIVKR